MAFAARLLIDANCYEMQKDSFLGKGSYGEVFKVLLKSTQQYVAMKKLKEVIGYEKTQEFYREMEIMASLRFPGALRLLGYQLPSKSKREGPAIFTELMSKSTLSKGITDFLGGKLSNSKMTIIIYGISRAMAHLHANNILHRDIKPDNVFLNERLEPVVADFGLSTFLEPNAHGVEACGSPLYMAPEILNHQIYTYPVDVYAFGILLVEIFTSNQNSFRLDDGAGEIKGVDDFAFRICNNARLLKPKKMPDTLFRIAQSCWAQDANARPTFKEISAIFEDPTNWLPDTNSEQFNRYKDLLDLSELCPRLHPKTTHIYSEKPPDTPPIPTN